MATYEVKNQTDIKRARIPYIKGKYGELAPGTIIESDQIYDKLWVILDYAPPGCTENAPPYAVALADVRVYEAPSPAGETYIVDLSIRLTPDLNGTVVGQLTDGIEVTKLEESSVWWRVDTGIVEGWVLPVFLHLDGQVPQSTAPAVLTIVGGMVTVKDENGNDVGNYQENDRTLTLQ